MNNCRKNYRSTKKIEGFSHHSVLSLFGCYSPGFRSMWIVRLALRRPYTFVAASLLMLLLGMGTCIEAPKDIYPYTDIPVVTIV
jgi:hypothetical protein